MPPGTVDRLRTPAAREARRRSIDAAKRPATERVWDHVAKGDGCWEWTGETRYGYGVIRVGGRDGARKRIRAHRAAWESVNGPITDGLFVCHHCDNRGCVRPDHLFLGTNADNMADAAQKGRWVGRNGKLTREQVIAIRSSGGTIRAVGKQYGVTSGVISRIRTGASYRTWR